jgi:hypothetical protein
MTKSEQQPGLPNYWVAGATVDGQDMKDDFIAHGFWFADAEDAQEHIKEIKPGDRMAIKRRLGQGATQVAIHALGVVEKVAQYKALDFRMIYVKWIRISPERRVPFSGFGAALHGPFPGTKPVVRKIFSL